MTTAAPVATRSVSASPGAGAAPPAPGHAVVDDSGLALGITGVFLALVIPVVLRHEMWRDEVQAWLLAQQTTIPELFRALHYEAHPATWYLLLRLVGTVTTDPRAVQWVALLFGAATAYVFVRWAPLPRVIRILFPFGYFVAYGFTVIARSYAPEMFVGIAACALATRATTARRRAACGVALLLLANLTIYGVILVLAFLGAAVVAALVGWRAGPWLPSSRGPERVGYSPFARLRPALPLALIAAVGVALSVAQIWPAADAPFRGNGAATRDASRLPPTAASVAYRLTPMWRAFVPIPATGDLGLLWESDALLHRSPRAEPIAAVLSIAGTVLLLLVLWRARFAATFFALATAGTLVFSLLIYAGALYHHGHFVLAFVMALWLAGADPAWSAPGSAESRVVGFVAEYRVPILATLFAVRAVGAAVRLVADYRYPFSESAATAAFLRDHVPAGTPIASYPGFNATSVSAYLGAPIYELDRHILATYTPLWRRSEPLSDSAIVAATRACCTSRGMAVLLVNHPLRLGAASVATLRASFTESIQPSEHFYVYTVRGVR